MQSAAPDLLDLSGETQATLDSYGLDRQEPENNRFRGYTGNAHAMMSRNCLLARRMIERGVRFVNLYHASWDHHDGLDKDLEYNCSVIDQPIGASLEDLKQRGLLDETLVVCTGEFGRTPIADTHEGNGQKPGRDHHRYAFSLWMAGGGVKPGQVVGRMTLAGHRLKTVCTLMISMLPCSTCLVWIILSFQNGLEALIFGSLMLAETSSKNYFRPSDTTFNRNYCRTE